jgi:transposase
MTATGSSNGMNPQPVLHVAFELGEKTWKLAFTVGHGQKPRLREIMSRDTLAWLGELAAAKERFGLPAEVKVISCYEAGREGFWLDRFLKAQGVENIIVDSSSIQVNRRGRRAKTDRLDAEKLLTMLVRWQQGESKVWSVVRPPCVKEEDARQLHRELETLKEEQTGHINRIKGLLACCGVVLEVNRHLPKRLKGLRLWDGSPLPAELHQRLLREFERMQVANRQIRELEKKRAQLIRKDDKDAGVAQMRQLMRLSGIGINSAWMYVREVFGWRKIKNRRELASLIGLVPTPYSSGQEERDQGISKAGNRRMRAMTIEIAWGWLHFQPQSELSRWYERRFAKGSKRQRRIGIVAVARKLLVALWKYLETGTPPLGAKVTDEKIIHYTLSLT